MVVEWDHVWHWVYHINPTPQHACKLTGPNAKPEFLGASGMCFVVGGRVYSLQPGLQLSLAWIPGPWIPMNIATYSLTLYIYIYIELHPKYACKNGNWTKPNGVTQSKTRIDGTKIWAWTRLFENVNANLQVCGVYAISSSTHKTGYSRTEPND